MAAIANPVRDWEGPYSVYGMQVLRTAATVYVRL